MLLHFLDFLKVVTWPFWKEKLQMFPPHFIITYSHFQVTLYERLQLPKNIQLFFLLASSLLSIICYVTGVVVFYLPGSTTKAVYLCGLGWCLGPGEHSSHLPWRNEWTGSVFREILFSKKLFGEKSKVTWTRISILRIRTKSNYKATLLFVS